MAQAASPRASQEFPRAGCFLRRLDPLTQVLDGIRLRCLVPSAHEMTAPWGVQFGDIEPREMRRKFESWGLPVPPHDPPMMRGALVAILRGSCCLEVANHGVRLPLAGGDIVLVTRRGPLILRDEWRSPVQRAFDLLSREHLKNLLGLRCGGGGIPTTFISGGFHFDDETEHPLLAALPPVIHIRSAEADATPWLEGTLKFLSNELAARRPGSQTIVNHLAHILFVQAVRAYAASLPEDSRGNWFGAIYDSELAPVIGLMHSRPEEPWTVASLAQEAGISRSAFSARFTAAVGRPPLQYLTDCRMSCARGLLRETNLGVKTVGTRVGYANESAFSSAFKRACGMPPAAYRRAKSPPRT